MEFPVSVSRLPIHYPRNSAIYLLGVYFIYFYLSEEASLSEE